MKNETEKVEEKKQHCIICTSTVNIDEDTRVCAICTKLNREIKRKEINV